MALFRKIVENQSRGCETCGDITKKTWWRSIYEIMVEFLTHRNGHFLEKKTKKQKIFSN